jgi:hypothetical protein
MTPKYGGVLSKKLPPKNDGKKLAALLREDEDAFQALVDAEWDQIIAKIPALLDHYEIDHNLNPDHKLFKLAMALAKAHVPGFQCGKKRGAPTKWDSEKRRKAAHALDRLSLERPGKSENDLAKVLHKQTPWNGMSRSPEALLKQVRLLNKEKAASDEILAQSNGVNRLAMLMRGGIK